MARSLLVLLQQGDLWSDPEQHKDNEQQQDQQRQPDSRAEMTTLGFVFAYRMPTAHDFTAIAYHAVLRLKP